MNRPPVNAPFQKQPGMNVCIDGLKPTDFFKLFIQKDVIQNLVLRTNPYAENCLDCKQFRPHSRMLKWLPVVTDELEVLSALVLSMGVVQKDDLEKYWSDNEVMRHFSLKEI